MILGVGLDVCDVERLRRALARPGFRGRVFDESEIRDCERRVRRHLHYSARFAAKEAFFKALGTGWGKGMAWTEVTIRSDGHGAPLLRVSGAAARRARSLGVTRTHVSLSHSGGYAAAVVVLEGPSARKPARRNPPA
jgi:holo-[acyl-carrier protein] synthase